MKIELNVFKGMEEIERTVSIPEWESVFLQSNNATIFNHPYLVLGWLNTSRLRGTLPILILGKIDDKIYIFPMELCKRIYWFYEVKIIYSMGGLVSLDFHDPFISGGILSSSNRQRIWEEVFDVIYHKIPECDLIDIPRLRFHSIGDINKYQQSTVSPYIDLSYFNDLDGVLSICKASHRGDVKRQIRRLNEKGKVTMRVFLPSEKEEAREALPRLLEAWELQWGVPFPIGSGEFYYNLIDNLLETGFIHFSVLKCGNKAIHWHFGFLYENRFHWFKPAMNIEWANYSPGKVHVAYLIEECIKYKIRYFDFLYGNESYKYDWGPTEEKLYRIKKWNGFRPVAQFLEEFVKPTYRFMKYDCFRRK